MLIEYITHASIYLKTHQATLLTDPFLYLDKLTSDHFFLYPPNPLEPEHFGTINYVYCSHIHEDHSHRETLKKLAPYIQNILLPAHKPDLEDRLRLLGFENILFLSSGHSVTLDGGITVTSLAHPNKVDTALIVEMDGKAILHANDCRLSLEEYKKIAEHWKIDYAFLPHTGFQDLFPHFINTTWEKLEALGNEREMRELEYLRQVIDILKPNAVIPYAYTLAYFHPGRIESNALGRTTPVIFSQFLKEKKVTTPCFVLQPGDIIETETNSVSKKFETDYWGKNSSEFLSNIRNYVNKHPTFFPEASKGRWNSELENQLLTYLASRLQKDFPQEWPVQYLRLNVNGDAKSASFLLDIAGKRAAPLQTGHATAEMTITMPSSFIPMLLKKEHGCYETLFSLEVEFHSKWDLEWDPLKLSSFYILSFISLFDYPLMVHMNRTSSWNSVL